MKEHVNQEVNSENGKRHEHGKRHGSLNRTGYESRRCFAEDRGEGAEKSGGFHQEFVKEVSFRKGDALYIFLIKRAGFAQGLFPTICVCGQGARVSLKTFPAVVMIFESR